jgi:HK97 family phage major capsid protein
MATAAAPNKETQEAKELLKGLLDLARTPASKAGVSPQEYLQGVVSKSHGGAMFNPLGHVPHRAGYRRKSMLGEVERLDGKRGSFGEWLTAYHNFSDPRANVEQHRGSYEVLKSYGTERATDQTIGNDTYVRKTALAESSGITGGYTVLPTMFSEQLFALAIEEAIVEPRARKQPLTTRQCTIPALDQVNETFTAVAGQSNLLAGLVMTWVSEAATRKESEPLFRNVVGTAWEGSFYALASNTLLADNAVGLDNYLTQLFGRAVGWYLDYAYLQGTGVGQPLGVQNAKAAIQVTRQSGSGNKAFLYTDACAMMGKIYWPMRQDNLVWIVHPTVIPWLLNMTDQSGLNTFTPFNGQQGSIALGRLLFQPFNEGAQAPIPAPEGAQSIGKLLGHNVMVSEKVPALGSIGDVGLYDFDIYCVFKRMDIEIAVSTQVAFLQNQTAWRVVVRADGQPLVGNNLTYADAGANSTASPFVLLK